MEGGGHDKEVASSIFKTSIQKSIHIYDQNGGKMAKIKINTLFMTRTAEKPYPLGPHIPIQPI